MAQQSTNRTREGEPSKTAEVVAAVRALHTVTCPNPVFEDPLAVHFAGPQWRMVIRNPFLRWVTVKKVLARSAAIMPFILLRARFGEDQLPRAMAHGIKQYVILGAGYDTFALRHDDLLDQITVYEVDHPATQTEKLQRMEEARLPHPRNTRYVSADLETESLLDALDTAGFRLDQPAVVAWFGVTCYLTRQAIEGVLSTVSQSMAPGSSVMFDYLAQVTAVDPTWKAVYVSAGRFTATRGEPWISSFNPAQMPSYLEQMGFSEVLHLAPDQVEEELLPEGADLIVPAIMGLCRAGTRRAESDG